MRYRSDLITEAQRIYQLRLGRDVPDDEANQILNDLAGFFGLLHRLEREYPELETEEPTHHDL
jgi:hypothetical protein